MNSSKQATTKTQKLEADLILYFPRINKDIFVVASDKVNETLDQARTNGTIPFPVVDYIRRQRDSGTIPKNHNQVLTVDKSNMCVVTMPKGERLTKFKSAYDIATCREGGKSNYKGFGK
jgi:hypothetical protein